MTFGIGDKACVGDGALDDAASVLPTCNPPPDDDILRRRVTQPFEGVAVASERLTLHSSRLSENKSEWCRSTLKGTIYFREACNKDGTALKTLHQNIVRESAYVWGVLTS